MTLPDPWPDGARSVAQHAHAVADLLGGIELGTERVALANAAGRVIADDVVARFPLPPFDNSQMDGYSVRTSDLANTMPLTTTVAAGVVPEPLPPGHAAAIMTGAAMPDGADAVVPVELTTGGTFPDWVGANQATPPSASVDFTAEALLTTPGKFVRPRGSDLARGATALHAGTRLTPAAVGVLAALGEGDVVVRRRPRALVYSTGTEVAAPGDELTGGQVHDANSSIIGAVLGVCGVDVVTSRLVADNPDDLLAALTADVATYRPDFIVTSGGISKGAFEVVRQALVSRGAQFGSVAMQPGGPQGLGAVELDDGAVPFIGFPGNPVSTLVSCEMFLRPALHPLTGVPLRPRRAARLAETVTPLPAKLQVRRGRVTESDGELPVVELVGGPSSHLLHAASTANVLVLLEPGTETLLAGAVVRFVDLD